MNCASIRAWSPSTSMIGSWALSHQPFLLISTYHFARAGLNKINGLGIRSRTANAPILARCDNAWPRPWTGIVTSTVSIAHYLANGWNSEINIFNTLESRQDPAREAFLARCDNAQLRRVSIMLHPPGTVVLCDEPRCGTTARPLFPRPRADRRIGHGGRQISVALCRFHQATFCRPQNADIRFSLLSRNTATTA